MHLDGREITCLLFDFDGTLVDAGEAICGSFEESFRSCGLTPPARSSIVRLIGFPLADAFAAVAPADRVDDLVRIYRTAFWGRSINGTRLLPHVDTVIPRWSGRVPLGIVSSRSLRGIYMLLDHFSLTAHFSTVIAADSVTCPKPHPEPVLKALSHLDLPAFGSVLVGDTPLDMAAARAAGSLAVGVTTGAYGGAELAAAGAHRIIAGMAELETLLG